MDDIYILRNRSERFLLAGIGSITPDRNLGVRGVLTVSFCALHSSETILGLEGEGPSGAILRLINVPG